MSVWIGSSISIGVHHADEYLITTVHQFPATQIQAHHADVKLLQTAQVQLVRVYVKSAVMIHVGFRVA